MITIGILMAYTTNYLFAPDLFGIIGWRWMLLFGAAPAAVLATGTYFLPETPRWLVEKGRTWEARNVLSRLRATDDIDDEIEQM